MVASHSEIGVGGRSAEVGVATGGVASSRGGSNTAGVEVDSTTGVVVGRGLHCLSGPGA